MEIVSQQNSIRFQISDCAIALFTEPQPFSCPRLLEDNSLQPIYKVIGSKFRYERAVSGSIKALIVEHSNAMIAAVLHCKFTTSSALQQQSSRTLH